MHSEEAAILAPLPLIPSKRYFTISEVSSLCDVKPHVLRYWEQEFTVLRPSKRRGNRRYYRREDVVIVWSIKSLLYEQGYTISGARVQLSAQRSHPAPMPKEVELLEDDSLIDTNTPITPSVHAQLIQELRDLMNILSN